MAAFIDNWSQALVNSTRDLFNGTPEAIAQLSTMVKDGKFYTIPDLPDNTDTENQIEQITLGLLLPIAWKMSNQMIWPFIMDSGLDCSTPPDPTYTTAGTASATGHCYNDRMYYLLTLCKGGAIGNTCVGGCPYNRTFCVPYGIDDLHGQFYGGLNYSTVIEG